MMPSREKYTPSNSKDNMLRGRGKIEKHEFYQQPTFTCPVCDMDFPPGFSDSNATSHVNSHFN